MINAFIAAVLLLAPQTPARPAIPLGQGTVSGRIMSSSGAPAAGVRVSVMEATSSAATSSLMGIAQTGADGRYRVDELPPGRYYVLAGPLDFPTYYPGTMTLSNASVITVAAGSTAHADFALARVMEGFTVSGRVIFHGGVFWPSRGVPSVSLVRPDDFSTAGVAELTPNGTFTVSHIRPGEYRIVTTFVRNDRARQVTVTVGAEDVMDVEVVFPHIVEIHGTLTNEEAGPDAPSFTMWFVPESETVPPPFRARPDTAERMEVEAGTFAAQLFEGDYRLVGELPSGYYLKSVTAGPVDLLRAPLKLTATDSRIEIRGVVARAAPARVSGRVIGSLPPLPLTVELQGGLLRAPKQTGVRPDGGFDFTGIAPGFYEATLVLKSGVRGAAVPVEVFGNDKTGVEIPPPSIREFSVHVSIEGGGPVPFNRLMFFSGFTQTLKGLLDARVTRNGNQISVPLLLSGGAQSWWPGRVFQLELTPAVDATARFALPEGEYQVALIMDNLMFGLQGEPLYEIKEMTYGRANLLAEPMTLNGTDLPELRVTLVPNPRSPRFKVSGRIQGSEADVQRKGHVSLTGKRFAPIEVPIEADGTFEFSQVPAGAYNVRLDSVNPFAPSTVVGVTDRNISDLTIQVPRLREIHGRVVIEGPAPISGFVLGLAPRDGANSIAIDPEIDGVFSIKAPEGRFPVTVKGLPPGYEIKLLTYGVTDLLRDPLVVSGMTSELTARLSVAPSNRFVKVGGRVTGTNAGEFSRIRLTGVGAAIRLEAALTDHGFAFSAVPWGVYVVSIIRNGKSFQASPALIAVSNDDQTRVEFSAGPELRPATSPVNEETAVAIDNMRAINTAEITYLSEGSGYYADIPTLIDAGFLAPRFSESISGYIFSISANGGDYVAAAAPVDAQSGAPVFFSTVDGVVRYSVMESLAPLGQPGEPVQ